MKITGTVIKGRGLAKSLFGIPTANLAVATSFDVPPGVYVAMTTLEGQPYPSLVYVSPTKTAHLEVHIFDFSRDLYGLTLAVDLLELIGVHMTWKSSEQMRIKVLGDLKKGREYFG